MTALHDIPDPDNLLPGIRIAWWIWAFTTIVVIALAWLIKTKRTQASRASHVHDNSYQSCREELIVFREQLRGLPLADVATRCLSLIHI